MYMTFLPIFYNYQVKIAAGNLDGFWPMAIDIEIVKEAWSENQGATHPVESGNTTS